LVLFGFQNRTFGPHSATMRRILISAMASDEAAQIGHARSDCLPHRRVGAGA
jgi:hypothetical protein